MVRKKLTRLPSIRYQQVAVQLNHGALVKTGVNMHNAIYLAFGIMVMILADRNRKK